MIRHALLALVALVVIGLGTWLIWWAVDSGATVCQPGYEYRYQYTSIVGKTQIAHYACVRTR